MGKISVAANSYMILLVSAMLIVTIHSVEGNQWCVPKPGVPKEKLEQNSEFACQNGVDCEALEVGGPCEFQNADTSTEPYDIAAQAAYAMNGFYQKYGECDFSQTGVLTDKDPSRDGCKFETSPNPGQGKKGLPSGPKRCVAKENADPKELQRIMDSLCSHKDVDCSPIQAGGVCANLKTVSARASYLYNVYFQTKGKTLGECNFYGTGIITFDDPSEGSCVFQA